MSTNRTLKDWIIATRPWSLTASFMPVPATAAYLAYYTSINGGQINWLNIVIATVMMLFFQAAGNLVSDYHDEMDGVDVKGSLNQVRIMQDSKFTPKEVLHYGYVLTAVGALLGILLLCRTSWSYIWLGVIAVVCVIFYMWFKAHVLGDFVILICYSILPAIGASYVGLGRLLPTVIPICLAYGLITVAILHINNVRDMEHDKSLGITSFGGFLGWKASKWVYVFEVTVPYVLMILFLCLGWTSWWQFLTWLTIPIMIPLVKTVVSAKEYDAEAIATTDQATAKLQMTFGLLYIVSFVIAALV